MNLVANLIVRNELDRYLIECIDLLLGFCDLVAVYDDGSTDGTSEALAGMDRVQVTSAFQSSFYRHEGAARQRALSIALEHNPTHILAIDGDELIGDGEILREAIENSPHVAVWTLCMQEVWGCDAHELLIRQDGGWKAHPVPILYRVESGAPYEIPQRAMASGRVPLFRRGLGQVFSHVSILHMGWARVAEREARHARYVEHDGGRFHAGAHLDSIIWGDDRVTLNECPWPAGMPATTRASVAAKVARP